MPVCDPGSKVLVSGANGFVAMWALQTLLEQGYSVRGTVRSPKTGGYVENYFKSYGDKLEIIVVEDITKHGAFDNAVTGVGAIMHIATPLSSNDPDPEAFNIPAIRGTLAILQSALQYGALVKRIVITSSCGAIRGYPKEPVVYTESDWADIFLDIVKEKGRDAAELEKYRASKVLAERAAWDFYKTHKDSIFWDLVVLHPPLIYGPPLQECTTLASVNLSNTMWSTNILNSQSDDILKTNHAYVDVRDLALAHVRALQKQDAAGERIIVVGGDVTWQEALDILHLIEPPPPYIEKVAKGKPGIEKKPIYTFDNSKGIRLLGMEYRPLVKTMKDILDDFYRRGWLG